jgi:hypothetical protein
VAMILQGVYHPQWSQNGFKSTTYKELRENSHIKNSEKILSGFRGYLISMNIYF